MKYEYDDEVNNGTSIVYFGAEWCGPCKVLGPIYENVANQFEENPDINFVNFYKIDVDVEALIATQYGVRNIPLILKIEDGSIVNKFIGVISEEKLFSFVAGNDVTYKLI